MRAYSPLELKARLESGAPGPLLVDVREPWEYEICRIDGSVSVPLGELAARVEELPHDRELVLICHHGMRSLQACGYLARLGYTALVNLDGGVDAWADAVDRDMARY